MGPWRATADAAAWSLAPCCRHESTVSAPHPPPDLNPPDRALQIRGGGGWQPTPLDRGGAGQLARPVIIAKPRARHGALNYGAIPTSS